MRRVLLSRWVQTLLGTAVLAALAWVFGPLWPPLEPLWPRIAAVQGLFATWAVGNALLEWRSRARDGALAAGLAAAEQESAAVGQTLTHALAALKQSGQRARLFGQPWYAIIGPPGAGKTTALLNAGLQFSLADSAGPGPVPGIGGTRLCEWWFTQDAVLIDTAGRYTTQDSDANVDRAGWGAFLALLKRTRPGQPLNGVIVAIALPDVAQAPAAERDAHAAAIARRIAELERSFAVRLPVYALFTKADLVAGFSEFFGGLTREQRDQVWGETFPLAVADAPARFPAGFRTLVDRLNGRLFDRLGAEHRADRNGLILGFPSQMASLEKPLAAFIAAAFAPTLLRGVYFASGTQEGTPIDRLAGAMARSFGIGQARAAALRPEQGRSYFLRRLLREVIFNEAMLVREPPGAARRRVRLRTAGFAAIALAVLAAAAALALNDAAAEAQLTAASTALAGYQRAAEATPLDPVADGDLRPIAGLLDQAAALGSIPGPAAGLGLDQAATLDAGLRAAYRDAVQYGLLPRLVWRLEAQMRGSFDRPDALYEATRAYLMLGGAGPLRPDAVRAWSMADWAAAYPGPEDAPLRDSLARHLDALLAAPLPPIALDGALIAQARDSLGRGRLADRVYASIRDSPAAAALPPWRPADPLGPAGMQVFIRASGKTMADGIPGLFTAAGFQAVLLPSVAAAARQVASESWVAGRKADTPPAELQALAGAVAALYAADFAKHWDAMLADLNIEAMGSLPQGAQDLYILASPESPLRTLLKSAAAQLQAPPVAARYKALADLATGAALDRTLRLVAEMQQQLAKLAALPLGAGIPPGGEDIGAALLADSARQPLPVARWLAAVSASAQALRTGNTRRQAAIAYNAPGGPGPACQAAVAHPPFAASGAPLPLAEFARVFAPGGLIDGVFNTQLKPYVDAAAKPWRLLPAPAPVTAADVAQFQRAAAIRDAFFPSGQAVPAIRFEIAPASAEPVTLTIGGTSVAGGIGHAAQITWPGGEGGGASIAAESGPVLTEDGPWAMLRLFARGRWQAAKGRQTVLFTVAGHTAAFDIRLGGRENPFAPGLFPDFRCPAVQ